MSDTQKLKDKVTTSQLTMTYVVMIISPVVKFLPTYAASSNTEAIWLSPLVALIPLGLLVLLINSIFSKYKSQALGIIIEDILGKYIGKFFIVLNLLWIFFSLSFFVRSSAERIASSIYPNLNFTFSISIGLLFIAYILHFSNVTIARMGQILLPIFIVLFAFITLSLLPKVRLDAILPISVNDLLPLVNGSFGAIGEFSFIFIFFFFSENIIEKENIKKIMTQNILITIFILIGLLISTIGVLGYSVTARSPVPYLSAVKQISYFDTIENIEAITVATWVLSDTLLFSALPILCLNMIKHLLKLSDTKNLINIFMLLLYISALGICNNRLELDTFANKIAPYFDTLFGFFTPMLIFIVGKIRKKL